MNAIEIKNITKQYNDVIALNQVSLSFEHGKIYGLLGRNGAGKSTLINIIANRIFADEGEVFIDDTNAKENMKVQEKIHCMSEVDLYDTSLKVKDQFKWINHFYDHFDIEKAYVIAEKFKLNVNKKFKALSKGYQSIFKLTIALSLDVPYIIFDEPVLGLDANHRELFYQLLLEEYENNPRTFILATHLIEEVSTIIEEIVVIDQGKVLLHESVESLMDAGYSVAGKASEVDAYCKDKHVIGEDMLGGLKVAYVFDKKEPISQASSLQFSTMSLQKMFVKLTQKGEQ